MDDRQGRRPDPTGLQLVRVFVTLVTVLTAGGCDRLPGPAVKQIREGHQAYRDRQYDLADRLLSEVIAQHPDAPDVAEAYLVRGLAELKSDKPGRAQADLEAGLGLSDRPELIALIHAQLGNLDYEAGRYESAAAHYGLAADDLPDLEPTDRVLLRYGISLQRSGQFHEAKQVLASLLLRFDTGPAVADARHKIL
ncbi:MAG: tol-pal system YbgF family protein, partial [Phycisphaerae bacterium]